jgi:penicillin-binding protein 1A
VARQTPKSDRSRLQRVLLRAGWLIPLAAIGVAGCILILTYAFASIPLPEDVPLPNATKVYDVNGRLIGTFSGEERRFIIDTTRRGFPEHVKEAVVAAEDRDFYEHNGVSIRGIVRAAWANVTRGEIAQGGSTITQQYIKNAVLRDPSRTITRKVEEAVLAIKLERRHSKDEILDFYLNTIYLGRGAYGIEAAALAYFDKHARDLTVPEAAYLAGIIPSPESYQPDSKQRAARDRRNRVLELMEQQGFITRARATRYSRGRVKAVQQTAATSRSQTAAYFMEWIRRDYLEPRFGSELYTSGLRVYTTLDLDLQAAAEDAVASVLTEPNDPEAALVSMTPRGDVKAFVGGRAFESVRKARGTIYATDPPGHQSGSTLKPFTLLTAIKEGISPDSRFSGASPVTIEDPECATGGEPWQPENFGGTSYGTLTLEQATTNSVNTVYAQLAPEAGPQNIAGTLDDFGFAPKLGAEEIAPNCSLALGAFEATPLEMTRAYAGFSGRGMLPKAMPIRYVKSADGDCIRSFLPSKLKCDDDANNLPQRVAQQNPVDVLTEVLTSVVTSGTAANAISVDAEFDVAGKTGTAQLNVSSWFAGYMPQLTTVVWMGYPLEKGPDRQFGTGDDFVPRMGFCSDPVEWPEAYAAKVDLCRPVHGIEVTGGSFPATIWNTYMLAAVDILQLEFVPFATPEDLPDEVINPLPPAPASPAPSESPDASPSPEPSPEPTPTAPPSPSPPPPTPTPDPSPTDVVP